MAEKTLTTKAVARMLDVSEATVKRWADEGLLPAQRTVGGHRRFDVAGIARFLREQKGSAKAPDATATEAPPLLAHALASRGRVSTAALFEALRGGQESEAAALLVEAYLHGETLAAIFDTLLCEAMRAVGDLWYRGELTLAEEHLATRTALDALHALRRVLGFPVEAAPKALCASIEDDFHELPTHLAQMIFESEGWLAINLGANTPLFALTEAALRHRPDVVCVSATILFNTDRAAHEYKEFRASVEREGIRVVLGGKGFTVDERVRQRFPAELYAKSFTELRAFIKQLKAGSAS